MNDTCTHDARANDACASGTRTHDARTNDACTNDPWTSDPARCISDIGLLYEADRWKETFYCTYANDQFNLKDRQHAKYYILSIPWQGNFRVKPTPSRNLIRWLLASGQ